MKYFLSAFVNVFLWVLVAVVLFLMGCGLTQRFFNKDGYTGICGIGYAVVVSGSMIPTLQIDDMILYQEHAKEDYKVGDIIVYVRDKGKDTEMLITHRIKEIDGDTLVTRGDANSRDDKAISFDVVVGKVVWRIAFVGKAVSFLRTPLGIIVIVLFLALIVIANLYITFARRKRKKVKTVCGEQYIKY